MPFALIALASVVFWAAGLYLVHRIVRMELLALRNDKLSIPAEAFEELRALTLSLAHIARAEHERANETKRDVEKLKKPTPKKALPKQGKSKAIVGQTKRGNLKTKKKTMVSANTSIDQVSKFGRQT